MIVGNCTFYVLLLLRESTTRQDAELVLFGLICSGITVGLLIWAWLLFYRKKVRLLSIQLTLIFVSVLQVIDPSRAFLTSNVRAYPIWYSLLYPALSLWIFLALRNARSPGEEAPIDPNDHHGFSP
jgi:CDP-diglyceride synthetase